MNLEETKQLLNTHHMHPNTLLGQNFLFEATLYPKLCSYAALSKSDVVLDAGAGFGWLTFFLADKCKAVVAVEKDPHVAKVLREQVKEKANIRVIEGDVLKVELPPFNKAISAPPYYLSSQLVLWLLERKVDRAVLILQKEFVERLIAAVGHEEYGWLTVVVSQNSEVTVLDAVPKELFYPQPEVDSAIVCLKPHKEKPFDVSDQAFFIRLVKWLFTQRNKKIAKAMTPFIRDNLKLNKEDAEKLARTLPFHDKRPRELFAKDFGVIENALSL
jgi:16S rRNA (adenine1518-N6/adenine1519-N6)-dimethyltransferase